MSSTAAELQFDRMIDQMLAADAQAAAVDVADLEDAGQAAELVALTTFVRERMGVAQASSTDDAQRSARARARVLTTIAIEAGTRRRSLRMPWRSRRLRTVVLALVVASISTAALAQTNTPVGRSLRDFGHRITVGRANPSPPARPGRVRVKSATRWASTQSTDQTGSHARTQQRPASASPDRPRRRTHPRRTHRNPVAHHGTHAGSGSGSSGSSGSDDGPDGGSGGGSSGGSGSDDSGSGGTGGTGGGGGGSGGSGGGGGDGSGADDGGGDAPDPPEQPDPPESPEPPEPPEEPEIEHEIAGSGE